MKTIKNSKELRTIIINLERIKLSQGESEIIIDYLEGHDYIIKTDKNKLFVVDVQDEADIFEESFKEIVCRVVKWNNELIECTENEINKLYATLDQHEEFAKLMSYLLKLKEDSRKLNEVLIKKIDNISEIETN